MSYISLFLHAFLIGPAQGVSGDYHMSHSQRHSSLTLPITPCGMLPPSHLRNGCQWHTTIQTAKLGQLLNAASDFLRASISLNARPFSLSDLPGYLSHGSLPLRWSWVLVTTWPLGALALAKVHPQESITVARHLSTILRKSIRELFLPSMKGDRENHATITRACTRVLIHFAYDYNTRHQRC